MIHKDLFRSSRVLGSVGNKIHHQTTTITKASGDIFEIGDGRILIYSSIGVQNSIF